MSVRRRSRRSALLALSTFVFASCGGESIAPGVTTFETFSFNFSEASGDTINPAASPTGRATDLVGVSGQVDAVYVVITLTFAQPVQPWSSGAATALDGFVDFDMDENPATGIPGAVDEYGGTSGVGAEAYLSLRDNGQHELAVVHVSGSTVHAVSAIYTGSTVTARIRREHLASFNVPPSERFRISAVVGNRDRPATDFAPNSGYFRVAR